MTLLSTEWQHVYVLWGTISRHQLEHRDMSRALWIAFAGYRVDHQELQAIIGRHFRSSSQPALPVFSPAREQGGKMRIDGLETFRDGSIRC
jgi:hypothetical protein